MLPTVLPCPLLILFLRELAELQHPPGLGTLRLP